MNVGALRHLTLNVLLALVLGIGLTAPAPARAEPAAPVDVDASLDAARLRVDQIKKRMGEDPSDAELVEFRQSLLDQQQRADQIAREQQPRLDSVQERLTGLGAAPTEGGEAADVAEQRRALKKDSDQIDARIKLARLLALESEQLSDQASSQRRARFRARLFERTDSVLAPSFWRELGNSVGRDTRRIDRIDTSLREGLKRSIGWHWLPLAGLVLAAAAARAWLGYRLTHLTTHRAPPGRVRRSLHAMAQALLSMVVPGVAAYALLLGLGGGAGNLATPEGRLQDVLAGAVGAACFAAYIAGLGRALLAPEQPNWRLLPVPDAVARGLRWYPLLIALATFAGWFLQSLAAALPVSLAVDVAINGSYALVLGLVLLSMVQRGARLSRQHETEAAAAPSAAATGPGPLAPAVRPFERPAWLSVLLVGLGAVLGLSVLGIAVGYVALGSFVVRQLTWGGVLVLTAYLLSLLIDDAFTSWGRSGLPAADAPLPAPPPSAGRLLRNQIVVLGSGALRLTIWLLALVLILAPFGESPGDLLRRTDQLRVGIAIGELQLRPTAVLQALIVFVLALLALRSLKTWLSETFLPTTSLDAGMRGSVTTLLGFLGTIVAIGLGLSAIGLALEKVAWIASALSVGIGFGLQAIVSNFVSGLILLAERPVKVGDWVALGGVEGDIRRINVRATEIQMGDRSTLIVPNSEFITKVVRNVTHESPIGLVQIKLPMPLDTDAARVREILLRALQEHEGVLDTPAPKVQLDGIADGNMVFNATGYVSSPRQSYGVRSALLFRILQDLRSAELAMWRAPGMVLREAQTASPVVASPPESPLSS